jgi:tetratricopeptide (TPR) repeat protein
VLTRIADAYRKVMDFGRSKEIYHQILEIDPGNPYALTGLGYLHFDLKEYREALAYWERMHEKDPRNIWVLTSIGNCFRKLKAYERGIPFFKKALEIEDGNFYALFGLADCYRGMNDPQESLYYWQKILAADPENKVILTRIGDSYRQMNDLDTAREFYQRALNIEFDSYAVLGLALINKEKGNHAEAIESLTGLQQNDPKNPRLYQEIATSWVALGKKDKALEVLTRAARMGVKSMGLAETLEKIQKLP